MALLVLAFCVCAVETEVDERMEIAQKSSRYEFMLTAAPHCPNEQVKRSRGVQG